jgi:hypothetical protein
VRLERCSPRSSRSCGGRRPKAPTFTKDIAPIFQEKCEACHRPNSIAPMSLVSFAEARPWAKSIKARVTDHQMPPWQIDRTVGIQKFKNDRSLTDDQVETIARWVDAGAPQGDPKDMPSPSSGRRPGLELRGGVRAERARPRHQVVRLHDAGRVAGRLGQAHHAVGDHRAALGARHRDPAGDDEGPQDRASRDRVPRTVRAGGPSRAGPAHAVHGMGGRQAGRNDASEHRQAAAARVKFHWDIHYSQAGEEITNKVEMGIYFYPKGQEPKYRTTLSLVPAALGTLDIRPNTVAVVEGFTTLREAARIESFQAHMHLRGKAMMLEAILPTGFKQVISLVSDFNFNWMTTYVYADDVAPLLPKGTILKVTAWHDNTSAKKSNPDPNQWVGWGDRTVDEMAHAWINIVYMKDEDFKIEQDKRRATQTTTAAAQQ